MSPSSTTAFDWFSLKAFRLIAYALVTKCRLKKLKFCVNKIRQGKYIMVDAITTTKSIKNNVNTNRLDQSKADKFYHLHCNQVYTDKLLRYNQHSESIVHIYQLEERETQ